VVGASSTGTPAVNLIVVGDMNELGDRGDPAIFEQFFPNLGELHLSPALHTCCSDSNWTYRFDRILTNSSSAPTSGILKDGSYPLNPDFSGHGEEHKPIYATVNF
jgi:hypothetical protein